MTDKKHILIVDDDDAILESMKIILEDEGYVVNSASQGEKLFEILKNTLPDLIILDYRLPGMTGTEITKVLKEDVKTKHIPILIVSSHDIAHLAKESGASAFFEKPFDIHTLITLVRTYLP